MVWEASKAIGIVRDGREGLRHEKSVWMKVHSEEALYIRCVYASHACVGRFVEVDDLIGMFGENTCNASGNRLISFLNEAVHNGRKLVI